MKKGVIAGAVAVLAAGGIIVGLLGNAPVGVAEKQTRVVRLDGDCPAVQDKDRAVCEHAIQANGFCLCFTKQDPGTVDDEVTSVSERPGRQRWRLVVCGNGHGMTTARWETSEKPVGAACTVAVEDALAPDVSATAIEIGDTEEQLRRVCAPCQVSAGSWGPCPHCLRWPGGCAAACR